MILGSSPIPSILGYVLGVLLALQQVIDSNGMPTDAHGWMQFGIAFGIAALGRVAKQANVSNAPTPTTVAQPVK